MTWYSMCISQLAKKNKLKFTQCHVSIISDKLSTHYSVSSRTVMLFSVVMYWTSVLIFVC